MSRVCWIVTAACWLGLCPLAGRAAEKVDFLRDVQPVLQQHCAECHGAEERNGGFSFDDPSSLFDEADSGGYVVLAGKPEQSELLRRVLSSDESDQMPPEGERLSSAEIELLRRWVAQGAPWPESAGQPESAKLTSRHWSFQPLSNPAPPPVQDERWPRNPLDRFIQARREAAGLAAMPDADPATLIRRISYGLTGLPPTPDEVRLFLAAAESPTGIDGACQDLVDRLLSRPAYGERWGRHWMDWVRYADTAGDNSDYPIPQAYLYRDYIIESFNQDLPYDRFLTEQIAGDLLPADSQQQRNRQTIATGYLAMARRFGSLVERYPWHLTIEDTIDNLGRTMLGLTVACARCHDHKFDPISTRDYYGLYGIFASTRYPFPGIELFSTQRDFVPLVSDRQAAEVLGPYQQKSDQLTAELERLLNACDLKALEIAAESSRATVAEQRKMREELDAMLLKARNAGKKLADHLKQIPPVPSAYAVQDGDPVDARIQIKGEPDRLGADVPRHFPEILGGQQLPEEVAATTSGRLQLARWITSPENPLTARVIVNRVWQRHFGQGLVATSSDFGLRGEPPTHPELLDWLAGEFIRSGWSIKHLHRLILTSRTYQLSSQDRVDNLQLDPENHQYWKFNRQRLDAESIRDTLLSITGSLDRTLQSEPHPFPPQRKWSFTQHHPFKEAYPSQRRSVYLMTRRLTADSYFQTFDGPNRNACTSDRDQSVTALQALYFVNDEFVHDRADQFAQQLLEPSWSDEQRLRHAFHTILCRAPTPDESALMGEHLAAVRQRLAEDADRQQAAWTSLTRSLLRLNEFLYLD
ncbi:PSD1 and planctomycete cytochrome C domain-containing protein [Candidatus Laterigemmans baculatus]|uniref:PSD1 and planctomycete cytochrome C domain-containing protein n=1 Tax=Candidatus Laterigemmans baculatus TaxID=2770505 RepID=UPI0013DCFB58|nr:DUF1553 domain-containing protein [Candidatus Laterigemmans baculatus]